MFFPKKGRAEKRKKEKTARNTDKDFTKKAHGSQKYGAGFKEIPIPAVKLAMEKEPLFRLEIMTQNDVDA